jgi:hypothetical protein
MISTDGFELGTTKPGHLQLYVTLAKAQALMPLLRGEATWPDTVRRWHSQGGSEKLPNGSDPGLALTRFLKPLY